MAWDKAMENIFGEERSIQLWCLCFPTEIILFRIQFVYRTDRFMLSFSKDINFIINLFLIFIFLIKQKKKYKRGEREISMCFIVPDFCLFTFSIFLYFLV